MQPPLTAAALDAVLAALPVGILVLDGERRIVGGNRLAAAWAGLPGVSAMLRRPCRDIFRGGECTTDCVIRRALAGSGCASCRRALPSGRRADVAAQVLRTGAGPPLGFLLSFRAVETAAGSLTEAGRAAEATRLLAELQRQGGRRLATARALGIHKATLFRKLRRLGLPAGEQEPPPGGDAASR